jgi:hypothetical protein
MTQSEMVVIEGRFNGPRGSGNGGYVAGLLAGHLGAPCTAVTLRAPVPLDSPMALERQGDGSLHLVHEGRLICQASAAKLTAEVPTPPFDWALAERARASGGGEEGTEFEHCIVCGRGRAWGDGLQVWTGRAPGNRSLSIYLPHENHADAEGRIRPEFVWGVLDCPGAWAAQDEDSVQPALTGRLTAEIYYRPHVGERCLVVGWRIGADGRKLYSGTALYTEAGTLCAAAEQLWIVLKNGG